VATFKVLPSPNGTYTAALAGFSNVEDKVIALIPIDAESGGHALATPSVVSGLRNGVKVSGAVIAVTPSGCRIFKPPISKGAHKNWDDYLCDSAQVVRSEGRGYSLVGLFGDGNVRAFSIPGLRDIGCERINHIAETRRLPEAYITSAGCVMTWVGPSQIGLFNVWGTGRKLYELQSANSHHYAKFFFLQRCFSRSPLQS
jgi:Lethal giant larvae(Lgl) like, C-terminal.